MKFIKRLALDRKNQTSDRFAVEADDRIVTSSKVSFQLPSGATGDRPASPQDGAVRYNTSTLDPEVYNISNPNSNGWEKIKTNRQSTITPQSLGYGDYVNSLFGPLSFDVATNRPQNVLVFIDNVYQTPTTNYTLVSGTSVAETATITTPILSGSTVLVINTTSNILEGQTVTAATGIPAATTVTNVDITATQITISNATTGDLNIDDLLTFSYQEGTFIQFNGEVPAKPVFVLLGIDGYNPNN